jgi:hypothetical protein
VLAAQGDDLSQLFRPAAGISLKRSPVVASEGGLA